MQYINIQLYWYVHYNIYYDGNDDEEIDNHAQISRGTGGEEKITHRKSITKHGSGRTN